MNNTAEHKLEKLKNILSEMGGVVIAFSGGVDSTFLTKVAHEVLGDKALAVTATSETYPQHELEEAKRLAGSLGVRHLIIRSEELEVPGFADNPPDRCYHCKKELFSKLKQVAEEQGLAYIIDGSNADDIHDYRPGMKAIRELGVRSPLREAGLTKEEIRELSRAMNLPTWNKPSFACLSSRFPYGDKITREKLRMVGEAENYLRQLGLEQLRVRHHGQIARIEVKPDAFPLILKEAPNIVSKLKGLGYNYVTLDLEGYRTGSMNEVLKEERQAWTANS
ncbi:ATP-dependent sacrificial sulfur transferase LarE [Calderihabitans maritimus]|uniref:NAD/GMP synthase domain-containing protein n=1 Tax=Calderihabitans maritimus TaxID=1246530 RepID=A0A1Z5HP16_9FIRM|nr:ATP-dependent sacrificial sulfur transferase LarE [Calderihabitans maritimus]GAW91020.1 hypothetical protein CHY_1281 [Calderihabitans maritimus]